MNKKKNERKGNLFPFLAGVYLLYLAYQLGSGYLKRMGTDDPMHPGFLIGAIAFLIFGAYFIVFNGTRMYQNFKNPPAEDSPDFDLDDPASIEDVSSENLKESDEDPGAIYGKIIVPKPDPEREAAMKDDPDGQLETIQDALKKVSENA